MKGIRYTAEFKAEAIKQITERGYSAVEVAKRLGVTDKSLYRWKSDADKRAAIPRVNQDDLASLKSENARLNKALKRAEEERDILKKAATYFAKLAE
jgi:transposase